ncbi:MAG: SDR family NAD(P)-dependent oxidoreductase [Faecousia sp.]
MKQVVIITGGSSGIGLSTASLFRASGCRVYEFSRRDTVHPDGVVHITADVADETAVAHAVAQVEEKEGRVDLLICNAGFGISGAAEFTGNRDAKRLLEVNLFGVVNSVKAVLPIMRCQGSGKIICISSVAAAVSIPFQAWYSVSKAAVSAYANALREEVYPFGIQVCAILPGDICTGFTGSREKSPLGDDIYQGRIARSVAVMERDERSGMSAEKAAGRIYRIAMKKRLKPAYAIGLSYSFVLFLTRILPGRMLSWIVRLNYAK